MEKIYFEHNPGLGHPESSARLEAVEEALRSIKDIKKIQARAAGKGEICLVHEPSYFEKVKDTQGKSFISLDPDTATSEKSFESAIWAVGGVLNSIDSVFNKVISNGFAFVRPPGHHAEKDRAMGFCLFNNMAVGTAYALKKYNLKKVLIIDIDLHHGNGTQNAFYNTDQVMYISLHQYPHYPGTGSFDERGEGKGGGFNLNFPLTAGADDNFYNLLFENIIIPVAKQYKPELVLISCGFDTYIEDPLGGMKMTEKGYAGMTRQILEMAEKICDGKVIYVLEGGYSQEGIKKGTKAILEEMTFQNKEKYSWRETAEFKEYYEEVKKYFREYWDF